MNEVVRAPLSAEEAIGLIGREIEDYLNGAADKEAGHLELGRQSGLNIDGIRTRWAQARLEREAKTRTEASTAKAEAPAFFYPQIQLKRASSSGGAGGAAHEAGSADPQRKAAKALILSRSTPWDTAKEFAEKALYQHGVLATRFYQGRFWDWNGRCYEGVLESRIIDELWLFLDRAKVKNAYSDLVDFRPRAREVEEVLKALKSGSALTSSTRHLVGLTAMRRRRIYWSSTTIWSIQPTAR